MICISSLCSVDKLSFHLFRSSASSFNFQYLLLFLKSSRGCVLLLVLPTPFTFVICPSWRRQFLLRIRPIQLVFLHTILFRSVLFSPIRSRTCLLVTFSDHCIFSILLQYHIWKLFKYFRSNFLSVQISEPYKAMLPLYSFKFIFCIIKEWVGCNSVSLPLLSSASFFLASRSLSHIKQCSPCSH